MALHILPFAAVGQEGAEGEVGVVGNGDGPCVERRRRLWDGAVGGVADDGRRIVARYVDRGLIGEDIRGEEAFQVGTAVGDVELLQPLVVGQHASLEVVEVHVALLAPAEFGDGQHAWKGHVVHAFARGHPLGPEVALHAEHKLPLLLGERGGCGIEVIDFAQRLRIFLVVEVEGGIGGTDDVVAIACAVFKGGLVP